MTIIEEISHGHPLVLGIVDTHDLGEQEVELEDGLEGGLTADLADLGSRGNYRVFYELLPVFNPTLAMTCQILAFVPKLLSMCQNWPNNDKENTLQKM